MLQCFSKTQKIAAFHSSTMHFLQFSWGWYVSYMVRSQAEVNIIGLGGGWERRYNLFLFPEHVSAVGE